MLKASIIRTGADFAIARPLGTLVDHVLHTADWFGERPWQPGMIVLGDSGQTPAGTLALRNAKPVAEVDPATVAELTGAGCDS